MLNLATAGTDEATNTYLSGWTAGGVAVAKHKRPSKPVVLPPTNAAAQAFDEFRRRVAVALLEHQSAKHNPLTSRAASS